MKQRSRWLVGMYIMQRYLLTERLSCREHVTYLREASASCSFNSMGNSRASVCGTSNKYRLSRFFCLTIAKEVSPAASFFCLSLFIAFAMEVAAGINVICII